MTDWLEFHDSKLLRLDATDTNVEFLLDAYIHRWERANGGWRGTGWMQGVRIAVSDAVGPSVLPALPEGISDGWLQLGSAPTRGLLAAAVKLTVVAGENLTVGSPVSCRLRA
jgi:hypothetical protein